MHTSKDELDPMVVGEYECRLVTAREMRISFESMPALVQTLEPVDLLEISPVEEHDRTMATIATNMGLVAS